MKKNIILPISSNNITVSNKNLSLRKRKGIYHGEFVFDFLKQKQFFIICHTNSMQLETYLPLRNELKKINFNFKFLKRKTVLNYFDKKNKLNQIQNNKTLSHLSHVFNGSIAIISPKTAETEVPINIFSLIETSSGSLSSSNNLTNQKLIMLGFFLNDFYLISKGKRVFNKNSTINLTTDFGANGQSGNKSIQSVSNILKVSSIFLTLTSLIQKFYKLSQPWTKIAPIMKSS